MIHRPVWDQAGMALNSSTGREFAPLGGCFEAIRELLMQNIPQAE